MANTEGMPDEFVESLMTTSTSSASSQQERLRRRLQDRMEMPMPEGGPAARVIRASGSSQTRTNPSPVEETSTEDPSTTSANLPPPVIGNIVERKPINPKRNKNYGRGNGTTVGKKVSRFAQQQQLRATNGFPSVHAPLGTFVQQKKATSFVASTKLSVGAAPKVKKSVQIVKDKVQPVTGNDESRPIKPTKEAGITTESLLEASKRDASDMLKGMTTEEIKEQQRELQAVLSPDMVAFLKTRRKAKENQTTHKESIPNAAMPSTSTPRVATSTQNDKEKLAEIVSKVQTPEELDDAYHRVMHESHPLEDGDSDLPKENEFALACDLLRSTNSRQILWAAKIVQQNLRQRVNDNSAKMNARPRDWPIVLPVSLRCLLDQPVHVNSGYQLHASVLESLYLLLILNAHKDHIVQVSFSEKVSDASLYQECFMDDALPTPSLDKAYTATLVQPITAETQKGTETANTAAYATQSSSTSAQSDGEAFDKDPMWTLLSKMKILPRLGQLLRHEDTGGGDGWPPEAWIAILGILAMIAQRSPGAASAMAHHDTIIPSVLKRILPVIREGLTLDNISNLEITHAALVLFGTLARQSRVVAKVIPLAEVLPPLLVVASPRTSFRLAYRLQTLGLQLWRTCLRYGVGLEALELMSAAASKHLTLPKQPIDESKETDGSPYTLSTDFVASLAVVVDCAKLAKTKLLHGQLHGPNSMPAIEPHILEILSMTSSYLSATLHQVSLSPKPNFASALMEKEASTSLLRWNAARLRFLASYWSFTTIADSPEQTSSTSHEEIKTEEWSLEETLSALRVLEEWADREDMLERALKPVAIFFGSRNWNVTIPHTETPPELRLEATASAFLQGYVDLLLAICTSQSVKENPMIHSLCESVTMKVVNRILQVCTVQSNASENKKADVTISLARRGWINRAHFALSKVFFHHMSGSSLSDAQLNFARLLVFSLLGRLDRGDEAAFAVLLSQDALFHTTQTEHGIANTSTSSPISSMFLAEVCGSDRARKQLDHSFKLMGGFGITKDGFGAFALDSLLSETDQAGPRPRDASSDLSLPLGSLWLWQSLSGQIRMKAQEVVQGTEEATSVVSSVLALLLELETKNTGAEANSLRGYASRIPLGAKLYFLLNVCLHTETVLRDGRVSGLGESLFEIYWQELESASVLEFAKACQDHTEPANKRSEEKLEERDQKLLELFNPEVPNELSLSKDEIRSLEALLDDLTEAYNDYGAQYNFFTKSMRLFLLPVFPSSIRIRTLRELRGVLHLFTLPEECGDNVALKRALVPSISSGISTSNSRDNPDLLDAIATVLVPGTLPRPPDGYILGTGVATLSRNLALSVQEERGLDAMKRRLIKLNVKTIGMICTVAAAIIKKEDCSREDLVDATLNAMQSDENSETNNESSFMDTKNLEDQLARLTL